MESTVFFKTKNENQYLYDSNKSMFLLAHPLIEFFYKNESNMPVKGDNVENYTIKKLEQKNIEFSKKNVQYYYEKYLFLRKHGFFSEIENPQRINNKLISSTIYNCLANIKQIVFEVTEVCNLNCKYCTYNELFLEHEMRESKYLCISSATRLLDYLSEIWNKPVNVSEYQEVILSFYGGEPLLNLKFIESVVDYVQGNGNLKKRFSFSMTTNGVLLKKHINYFIKHDFKITISLDGDYEDNQYRVNHKGENSHHQILDNLLYIKKEFPNYYSTSINFNTVFHDKNSIDSIYSFFSDVLDKSTNLLEVNANGAKPEKVAEIEKMYNNISKNYSESSSKEQMEDSDEWDIESDNQILTMLRGQWANYLRTYNDIYLNKNEKKRPITGTCTPFWKKMFVTAKGHILPCERIDYKYSFGRVTSKNVDLNYDAIVDLYNNYYENIFKQCKVCYISRSCIQCMFYVDGIEDNPKCHEFHNKYEFEKYLGYQYSQIEEKPKKLFKLLKNTIYE